MKKSVKVILMMVVVMSLMFTACTTQPTAVTPQEEPQQPAQAQPTSEPQQPTSTEPTSVAQSPSSSGETIEIEFWTLLTGALGERLDALVQEFNSSQTEVKILNVNQGGYNELQQKLLASVAAGNPPVLTMVDYKYVPFYAREGVFEPITAYASEEDMKDFIPGLLTDLTFQGQVYALPFNRSTQGLYYNKDLFREAGLDPEKPPTTWDEVKEYAEKLTDSSKQQYGIYATGNMQWHFEPLVDQAGGAVSDADCNFIFNNEQGQIAAQLLQGLVKDGYALIPANLTGPFDQQATEFINGKVGMMRQSTAIQGFIGNTVSFDWGFAMAPAGPGGQAVTGGGANIAMTAKATPEQKEAAWKFMKWITSTEKSAEFHMATGYMPSRFSVMELPDVKAFYETHPSWLTSVEQLEFAKPTACGVLNNPQWQAIIEASIDRILINNEDVKTVLDEAVAELQPAIDEARANGTLIK